MKHEVELNWIRFRKWKDVLDSEDGKYEFPCVYILAENDGTPLYIGKAATKPRVKRDTLWSGGLRARYYQAVKVLDASMAGTGRYIFIAEVDSRKAGGIEKQLIYENKPEYNENGKTKTPLSTMILIHKGTPPKLKK